MMTGGGCDNRGKRLFADTLLATISMHAVATDTKLGIVFVTPQKGPSRGRFLNGGGHSAPRPIALDPKRLTLKMV